MRIAIIGTNHAEILKLSGKQENHGFAEIRNGAYQIYPEEFARLEIYNTQGELVETDEIVVFPENRTTPYNPLPSPEFFDINMIVTRAEVHKISCGKLEKPYISFTRSVLTWGWYWWPMLLVGGIFVYGIVTTML